MFRRKFRFRKANLEEKKRRNEKNYGVFRKTFCRNQKHHELGAIQTPLDLAMRNFEMRSSCYV
jgi:hypothetical protein